MSQEDLQILKKKIYTYEEKHLNGYIRIYPIYENYNLEKSKSQEIKEEDNALVEILDPEENYQEYMDIAKQIQDEFTGTKRVPKR